MVSPQQLGVERTPTRWPVRQPREITSGERGPLKSSNLENVSTEKNPVAPPQFGWNVFTCCWSLTSQDPRTPAQTVSGPGTERILAGHPVTHPPRGHRHLPFTCCASPHCPPGNTGGGQEEAGCRERGNAGQSTEMWPRKDTLRQADILTIWLRHKSQTQGIKRSFLCKHGGHRPRRKQGAAMSRRLSPTL